MKARSDIYTWPMALVAGTVLTLALFFSLPGLRLRQTSPEPPVIEIDFTQWQEPAPLPKTTTPPPPKPVVKPKPRPLINESIKAPIPPKVAEKAIDEEPVVSEKPALHDPPSSTPPIEARPPALTPQIADIAKPVPEELPVPTPIYQLTAMPRFVHKVEPDYPPSMRALGREARVKLEALIDHKGRVRKVTILESGGEAFDAAAKSAVLASSFIPANVEGKAVAVLMRIPIVFRLK